MCNFVPDNRFIPGFYMDVPGVDTTAAQLKAIHDPAVDLGALRANVFQTQAFQMTASLLNPWGGALIDKAQLRLKIDASTAFKADDVTAVFTSDGESVPFTVDPNGDLLGKWGPDTDFPVAPGYNVSTTFNVTVAAGAPTGECTITLDLVDLDAPTTVLATETGTIAVNANVTTVLWVDALPKLAIQDVSMTIPLRVYLPVAGTAHLALTITGPGDDPHDAANRGHQGRRREDVREQRHRHGAPAADLNAETSSWDAGLEAGYTEVTWYTTVAVGALVKRPRFSAAPMRVAALG